MYLIIDSEITTPHDVAAKFIEIFPEAIAVAEHFPDGTINLDELAENVLFVGEPMGTFTDNEANDGTVSRAWMWDSQNFTSNEWGRIADHYSTIGAAY